MKKTKKAIELVAIICVASFVKGQTVPNVHQTATNSSCANIIALSGAKVDCFNLTPAQKKALENIPAILKMSLENQDYLEAIMKRLDEMKLGSTQVNAPVCPNGICPTAPNFGTQTVVNTKPPARHLTPAQKTEFADCLAKRTGTVDISAMSGDMEADAFAEDWLAVFHQAGWSIDQDRVMMFMFGGGMWTSTQITFSGSINADLTDPKYDPNSPGGAMAECLWGKVFGTASDPPIRLLLDPKMAKDHVEIQVGPHP
jgi:hypothetical protein